MAYVLAASLSRNTVVQIPGPHPEMPSDGGGGWEGGGGNTFCFEEPCR